MSKQQGMTLIELVIAMAITALIGVIGSQFLNGMMVNNEQLTQRTTALQTLQRALTLLQADLDQIALLAPPYKTILTAHSSSTPGLVLAFTRYRTRPSHTSTVTVLERVRYVLEADNLVRYSLPVAKPAQEEGWYRQRVLDHVEHVMPTFLFQQWQAELSPSDQHPLAAIRLILTTQHWQTLELISMTGGTR